MKTGEIFKTWMQSSGNIFPYPEGPAAVINSPNVDILQSGQRSQRTRLNVASKFPVANSANLDQGPHHSNGPNGWELTTEHAQRILAVNCGSSSLKYCFYNTADASRDARGRVERIGLEGTRLSHHGPRGTVKRKLATRGFPEAFQAMIAELTAKETGAIREPDEVDIVTHRVVHGGEKFIEATLITSEVLEQMEALNSLAPLHNPVNLAGIREMQSLFPAVPHIAVFDTAFHHTLPSHAYLYGLPYELYADKGVRRYGFHGTSHQYVSLRVAESLNTNVDQLRVVSCHLGNGSSVCAINKGISVDTSMGFTPAEGLIMGTRCGDVDAGVLAFLERTEGMSASQCEEMLNTKSGLLGLSGISSDMREILQAANEGHARASVALKTYCYRARKYIGAYAAAMGGLDAVVFTGGIGEGSAEVRSLILEGLDFMGICLEAARNHQTEGKEIILISSDSSKVAVFIIPTDEERMMAHEAIRCLKRANIERTENAPA